MTEASRRSEDRILQSAPAGDMDSISIEELRERKSECEMLEAELSYVRRLLQGKIDILRHELEKRAAGGESVMRQIIETLPVILGESPASGGSRLSRVLMPRQIETRRREVECLVSEATLAELDSATSDELAGIVERLADAEAATSQKRRRAQEILDELNAELIRRYREGQEDPTALLKS